MSTKIILRLTRLGRTFILVTAQDYGSSLFISATLPSLFCMYKFVIPNILLFLIIFLSCQPWQDKTYLCFRLVCTNRE